MANFKTKFGTGRQDWETPDEVYKPLDAEFHFTLDVCAYPHNAKCERYYTEADNALALAWNGVCWMNPPFGTQGKWVRKAYEESQRNGATVVCLLPARTNTSWWHDYCMKGEVRFLRGRPKFKGAKHGLPQPLAIVVFKSAHASPSNAKLIDRPRGASDSEPPPQGGSMQRMAIPREKASGEEAAAGGRE